ncbi:glycosyltransferase, partial [Escherichia coli]|nr:glycosyltransferase [Escherichia coli]
MQKIEKISVLLSIYFKENEIYLDEAFKSLAIQKTMIDEVVAVIDGPISNGLWRVVRKWDRELPLKIVELNENVGLGKALNAGLQACSNDL